MLQVAYSRVALSVLKKSDKLTRFFSNTGPLGNSGIKLKEILTKKFPEAKSIEVVDISGGCGAMFQIAIESPNFKGLSIVKQHRLVNEALKEEIKDMHGIRISTSH